MFNNISGIPIPERSSCEVSSNNLRYRDSLFYFLDTNIQYKHTSLIRNKQQHIIPCRLATPVLTENKNFNDTSAVIFNCFSHFLLCQSVIF